jgi:hypothetical protein
MSFSDLKMNREEREDLFFLASLASWREKGCARATLKEQGQAA